MEKRPEDSSTPRRGGNTWMIFLVLLIAVALMFFGRDEPRSEITASFFKQQIAAKNVENVQIGDLRVLGTFKTTPELPKKATDAEIKKTAADGAKAPKLRKEFYFDRPAGDAYATQLTKELEPRR